MGVAVLPPQDCFNNHHHRRVFSPVPHKPRRSNNPNPHPNSPPNPNMTRSSRRRRNSPPPSNSGSPTRSPSPPSGSPTRSPSPPVTGQVRILKRGENLDLPTKPAPEQARPEPVPGPSQPALGPMPDGFYAGFGFVESPPPCSLPLPAFFKRNCGMVSETALAESVLRRALKLQ